MGRYAELGVPELILLSLGFILSGAATTFLFSNLHTLITTPAAAGGFLKSAQPYLDTLRPVWERAFGKAAQAIKLDTILLAAILMVLIGIWRTLYVANQIALEKQGAAAGGNSRKDAGNKKQQSARHEEELESEEERSERPKGNKGK